MVIAYIIHNLSVGDNLSPLSYCWFGFLIIHMVASMSSYQSMVSSYCRLPFFALALLFYCLTRICFICEAMFPSTSHSSTMKSPVTWGKDSQFAWKCLRFFTKMINSFTFPFTLIVFSPIFMQEEKLSPCSIKTP